MEAPKELSDGDFQRIVERIKRLSGIVIQDHKRTMVQTRIAERMSNLGLSDFGEYLDSLDLLQDSEEEEHFCNALTTNLTSFFREDHHFDHFSKEIDQHIAVGADRLRIWSAGCSTGQEAYSIALLLEKSKVRKQIPDTKILATDIDTDVLQVASSATYPIAMKEQIPRECLTNQVKSQNASLEFGQGITNYVSFKRLNLLQNWPMKGQFDFIFCRNVVIYFSAETKARLISRFANILKPGGILYLGHSETILGDHPMLKNAGKTIYKKAVE